MADESDDDDNTNVLPRSLHQSAKKTKRIDKSNILTGKRSRGKTERVTYSEFGGGIKDDTKRCDRCGTPFGSDEFMKNHRRYCDGRWRAEAKAKAKAMAMAKAKAKAPHKEEEEEAVDSSGFMDEDDAVFSDSGSSDSSDSPDFDAALVGLGPTSFKKRRLGEGGAPPAAKKAGAVEAPAVAAVETAVARAHGAEAEDVAARCTRNTLMLVNLARDNAQLRTTVESLCAKVDAAQENHATLDKLVASMVEKEKSLTVTVNAIIMSGRDCNSKLACLQEAFNLAQQEPQQQP